MKIAGLQKLTLLDYPGKTACTVFTWGCNLRCPFCHNAGLVTGAYEEALTAEADHTCFELPDFIPQSDLPSGSLEDSEWDCYERSILLKLADDVKIAIKGGRVTMSVSKKFSE